MPSIPLQFVDSRYKPVAWVLLGLCYSAITLQFLWSTKNAISNVSSSPTTSIVIDGSVDDGAAWGAMPCIVILGRHAGVEFKYLAFFDTEHAGYGDTLKKFRTDMPNYTFFNAAHNALVVNLSSYHPDFQIVDSKYTIHSTLTPNFKLCWSTPSAMSEVYLARPDTPLSAFPPSRENETQYIKHQFSMEKGYGVDAELEKTIVPSHEAHSGFPGENVPVVENITLVPGSLWGGGVRYTTCVHAIVPSPLVTKVVPISVMSQVLSAASTAGGSIAIVSTAFALLFVRKRKPAADDPHAYELTLRGQQETLPEDNYAVLS